MAMSVQYWFDNKESQRTQQSLFLWRDDRRKLPGYFWSIQLFSESFVMFYASENLTQPSCQLNLAGSSLMDFHGYS